MKATQGNVGTTRPLPAVRKPGDPAGRPKGGVRGASLGVPTAGNVGGRPLSDGSALARSRLDDAFRRAGGHPSTPMREREIFRRSHLDEARDGALELAGLVAFACLV